MSRRAVRSGGGENMGDGRSENWAKAEPMAPLMSQKIRDSTIKRSGGVLRASHMAFALGGLVRPNRAHQDSSRWRTAKNDCIVVGTREQNVVGK